MWRAVELVSGRKYDRAQQLPFAVTPGAPLQVKDLMRMLRDHCEGTDLDKSADYTAGNPHRTNIGTICHEGTQYSFVAHLRPGLPAEIAPAIWIAMFHPDVQGYSPWYPSVTAVPPVYSSGDYTFGLRQQLDRSLAGKTKERSAAYTRFVSLNEKVHTNSAVNVPRIRKAWQSFEEEGFRKQAEFEKQFLSRQKADATTTTQMITDQTSARAIEVYENADALARSLD
jgi:dipeptidase